MAKQVNPLNWNVRVVNPDGTPTKEFMAKWAAQARINGSIPSFGLPAEVSAVLDVLSGTPNNILVRGPSLWEGHPMSFGLDKISSSRGDLLARKAGAWGSIASPSDATKFLTGSLDPVWGSVHDSDLVRSDITTNNVDSTAHGFVPKSPVNASKFLAGSGTPAWGFVNDSDLALSNILTNNVSTSKHGFAPILPNDATKFLDGTGGYSVPPGSGAGGGASFFMPEVKPGTASSALNSGAFIALPFLAKSALVATGIEVWMIGGAGASLVGGLYEATAANGTYPAAALKAQSGTVTGAADKNLLPFASPFTLVPGKWYWYGLAVISGSITTIARQVGNADWNFSTQTTGTLAAAPVSPSSTVALWTCWLY